MNILHDDASVIQKRKNAILAEQRFCNEALESGAFDELSDQEWEELCAKVAAAERAASKHEEEAAAS